jgi:nitroreductase
MLDLLYKRRSVRKFADAKIEADKLERILNAGLLAPSSKSKYPCEFVVIDNKDINMELSKCKPAGGSFLKYAPVSIVVCGDENASDVWIEDTSIAASFMLLQAEKEELGACWVQVRERNHDDESSAEEYVQKLLNIPANQKVLAIIALGYKLNDKEGRDSSFLMKEKIHRNKF